MQFVRGGSQDRISIFLHKMRQPLVTGNIIRAAAVSINKSTAPTIPGGACLWRLTKLVSRIGSLASHLPRTNRISNLLCSRFRRCSAKAKTCPDWRFGSSQMVKKQEEYDPAPNAKQPDAARNRYGGRQAAQRAYKLVRVTQTASRLNPDNRYRG
jgi:hypothetical protein